MERLIRPDEPEARKWHLLAARRAKEIESRIQERRAFVTDQLARAQTAMQAGRPNESVAILAMLKEKYGHYTDLADLLGGSFEPPAPANFTPAPAAVPPPGGPPASGSPLPAPTAPGQTAAHAGTPGL